MQIILSWFFENLSKLASATGLELAPNYKVVCSLLFPLLILIQRILACLVFFRCYPRCHLSLFFAISHLACGELASLPACHPARLPANLLSRHPADRPACQLIILLASLPACLLTGLLDALNLSGHRTECLAVVLCGFWLEVRLALKNMMGPRSGTRLRFAM